MWTVISTAISNASTGDWLLVCFTVLLLLYIWGTWKYDYFEKLGMYSVKPKYPFIGNLSGVLFGRTTISDLFEEKYKESKGHSVFGLFSFHVPSLMIRDPELIKIVTVKSFDHFTNHQTFEAQNLEPIFFKNLTNLKDDHWRRMRATLSPAFTTSKIKGMFPLISQCAEQMAEYLSSKYTESEEGRKKVPMEMDMKDVCSRMANDVIASVAFGVQCDSLKERDNEFYTMGKTITSFSFSQILIFVGVALAPKLMEKLGVRILNRKAVHFFDSLVHETIRERQKKGIFRPDMLQLLMQAREGKLKAEPEDGGEEEKLNTWKSKIEDDEISAQAIIFFFGGFETVTITLCLIAYTLSFHPREQKRLQEEIDEVFKTTDGNLTYEAVQGMKYLDAVINECMRLHPTAPATDRQCNEDTELPATDNSNSIRIPKGLLISIPIIGLHHDPEYWTDPLTFNPDRFSEENKQNIKPFTFMPFGVGPRICIAQRFALLEMKLALVHLLRKFDLVPSPKLKYPLEYAKGFKLSPKGGFLCCLQPRQL